MPTYKGKSPLVTPRQPTPKSLHLPVRTNYSTCLAPSSCLVLKNLSLIYSVQQPAFFLQHFNILGLPFFTIHLSCSASPFLLFPLSANKAPREQRKKTCCPSQKLHVARSRQWPSNRSTMHSLPCTGCAVRSSASTRGSKSRKKNKQTFFLFAFLASFFSIASAPRQSTRNPVAMPVRACVVCVRTPFGHYEKGKKGHRPACSPPRCGMA